jgi:hypothetical protein
VAVQDAGSGIDPNSLAARIDGSKVALTYSAGRVTIVPNGFSRGKHALELTVADYQETKNMETFGEVLPNTRVLRVRFTVR